MMMIRALSTRKKDQGGYKKLSDEEAVGIELLKGNPQSVAASSHGKSPEVEKTGSSVHPLLSFFDVRLRKKKKSVTTAKPEFARYLEYVKEGEVWNTTSNGPAIYYR